MGKLIFCLSLLVLSVISHAQDAGDEAAIRQAVSNWYQGWMNNNTERADKKHKMQLFRRRIFRTKLTLPTRLGIVYMGGLSSRPC